MVEARTNLPGVVARLGEFARGEDGVWRRTIHLVPSSELAAGRHEGQVHLYTADDRYKHLQVPFTLVKTTPGQVTALPREVDISGPAGQPLPSRMVILRSPAHEKIEVADAKADDPAILLRWAANADGVVAVRVQVDAKLLGTRSIDSAIHIRLAKPTTETLTIPVHCKLGD